MNKQEYKNLARLYRSTLTQDILPFWKNHSLDQTNGGYFTCLNRQGRVYDTDKFIWLQGRQAWTFSMLYNQFEPNDGWREIARLGVEFLIAHGMSKSGDFYFATTASGEPLVKPYNIFSDCFAAMAFSQFAKVSGEEKFISLSYKVFRNIQSRQQNPKGVLNKNTGTRVLKDFALPMILSNLVLEMEEVLPRKQVNQTLDSCTREVMETFLDSKTNLILEFTSAEGKFIDCFEGRLINPGHGLEAMWFMLDIGVRRDDPELIQKATEVILSILDFSWDQEFGGIYYFMDIMGYPTQQLEWDQKLWWVHLEALVALAKAYLLTGNSKVEAWYLKVHKYTWEHFPDPEYGEWYGYLNRQGKPHLTLKGGKWKGCYHVPRAFFQCWQTFQKLADQV